MSALVLATKLFIPQPRPGAVRRPHLIGRLNEGLCQDQGEGFARKLTLIAAPAGFGKTTLAGEWVAGLAKSEPKISVAWLSLERGDSDPERFLAYFIAALQTIQADCAAGVLGALQTPQPPAMEVILTALLNEIATIPVDSVLVLDDYQLVDSPQVDQALTFLVEHLPPQMHLVIGSREDPPLPRSRARGRGQLSELRAADLRFTPAEAAEFLNRVMNLDLPAEDVAALEDRTEGWIADLQLAALAVQGPRACWLWSAVTRDRVHPTGAAPLPARDGAGGLADRPGIRSGGKCGQVRENRTEQAVERGKDRPCMGRVRIFTPPTILLRRC